MSVDKDPDEGTQEIVDRSSTPVPTSGELSANASPTILESGHRVEASSRNLLPEFLPASNPGQETTILSNSQLKGDLMSSVCEFPALPSVEPKVRFLTKTAKENCLVDCPSLHGGIPVGSESGTEACVQSESGLLRTGLNRPSTSASKGPDDELPELSGRSRAILKTYFLDADALNLPQRHPTVAFRESRMYHLLRVLSDETLRKSYTTMEQMIIDAVNRNLSTAPSRTAHFQTRVREQTAGRWIEPDSSASELDQEGKG